MFVIVLVYVCVRYLQTLLSKHTELLAFIGLLLTILYVLSAWSGPLLRGGL